MATTKEGAGTDALKGLREAAGRNPATQRLVEEGQRYLQAQGRQLLGSLTERVTDLGGRLTDYAEGGGGAALRRGAESLKEGDSPTSAVGKAAFAGAKEKVKSAFGGGGKGKSDSIKATNIVEQIDVGLPRSVVYNQWTQFQEFGRITKGVRSVSQEDEIGSTWRAKIAFSTRSWSAKIREQVPDQRIAWSSDGAKGSVDGVVSFHELAPDLTRVLLVLEYHPKGLFEKTGNLWRAQGRRARLDLKHFRRFLMMRGEESGAWRGEIRDGEMVRSPEEVEQQEQEAQRDDGERGREQPGQPRDDRGESEGEQAEGAEGREEAKGAEGREEAESAEGREQAERGSGGEGSRQAEDGGPGRREGREQRRRGEARSQTNRRGEGREQRRTGQGAERGRREGGTSGGRRQDDDAEQGSRSRGGNGERTRTRAERTGARER